MNNQAENMPCNGTYCQYCNSHGKEDGCKGQINMVCDKIASCSRGENMRQEVSEMFKTVREMEVTDTITMQVPDPQGREKTKVTDIDIIVDRGISTEDKIYYGIKYKVAGENEYHIGYGSYDLKLVQEWFDKEFEPVTDESAARESFIHMFCGRCRYQCNCMHQPSLCSRLSDALKIMEG